MILIPHFSKYSGEWPWPNFNPKEIACKHCGELCVDEASMNSLHALREAWGKPVIINSAHRCPVHNAAVGGASKSQHLALAFDCRCPSNEQATFAEMAKKAGFTGIGQYPDRGFVHVDCGPARTWIQ